jgi:hypothetical protein
MKRQHIVVVLGGNSVKNREWVAETSRRMEHDYPVVAFAYEHWNSPKDGEEIHFENELVRLNETLKEYDTYSIVAKSAGFLLALMAVSRGIINPVFITGFGLPLRYAEGRNLDVVKILESIATKCSVLCIQSKEDPQGKAIEVEGAVPSSFVVHEVEGDSHDYVDYDVQYELYSAFAAIHRRVMSGDATRVERADNLLEAVRIVEKNRVKYALRNCWLYTPDGSICLFAFMDREYVVKFTSNKKKASKELDNAQTVSKLLDTTKLTKSTLRIVVPKILTVGDGVYALLSPFVGEDYNQRLYTNDAHEKYDDDIYAIFNILKDKQIIYPGFLPRNVVINKDEVLLLDFEDVEILQNYSNSEQARVTHLIGWSNLSAFEERYGQIYREASFLSEDSLSKYEKALTHLINDSGVRPDTIRILAGEMALAAEQSIEDDCGKGLMKRDDVINIISEHIPVELEVLLDLVLAYEKGKGKSGIYWSLSSLAKRIRMNHELLPSKETTNRLIKEYFMKFEERINNEHRSFESYMSSVVSSVFAGKYFNKSYEKYLRDFIEAVH